MKHFKGIWVAQSFKCPTLGFGSGYDLTIPEIEPHVWLCTVSAETAQECLFPSLSALPPLSLSLFLKINKLNKIK